MKLFKIWHDGQGYDVARGFVVAAKNETDARAMIAGEPGAYTDTYGDEGRDLWLAPPLSTCVQLGRADRGVAAGIILRDFNAG